MSRARDTANQINRVNSSAADATAITVDSSENVGVGVVPKTWNVYDQALQIGDGAAIWTYQNAEAHYSVNSYYNSGNKYIGTGTALQYEQAAGAHSFKTATSGTADAAISWNTKVNIDSDGLKFNGDTAAANALNDYEEGTWTATINGQTTAPSSPQTTTAYYTKVGNMVTVFMRFSNKNTTGASGNLMITGLPFSCSAVGSENQAAVPMVHNLPVTEKYMTGFISNGSTTIFFINNKDNTSWTTAQISSNTGVYLNMNITYQTTS